MLARISCSILAAGVFASDVEDIVGDIQAQVDLMNDPDFAANAFSDPDTVAQFEQMQAALAAGGLTPEAMQALLAQGGADLPEGFDPAALMAAFQGGELPEGMEGLAALMGGLAGAADMAVMDGGADDKDDGTVDLDWATSMGFEAKDCELERGDTKCEKELPDGRDYECELEGEDEKEWKCKLEKDECTTKAGNMPFLVSECRGPDKEKLPGIFKELVDSLSGSSTKTTSDAETTSEAAGDPTYVPRLQKITDWENCSGECESTYKVDGEDVSKSDYDEAVMEVFGNECKNLTKYVEDAQEGRTMSLNAPIEEMSDEAVEMMTSMCISEKQNGCEADCVSLHTVVHDNVGFVDHGKSSAAFQKCHAACLAKPAGAVSHAGSLFAATAVAASALVFM